MQDHFLKEKKNCMQDHIPCGQNVVVTKKKRDHIQYLAFYKQMYFKVNAFFLLPYLHEHGIHEFLGNL